MLKLIVGLGNPGRQYERTRHNAGFWFLEGLDIDTQLLWSFENRFQAMMASLCVAGDKIILLRPETFMNKSGQAVGSVARYFKISAEQILVVHDELDFTAGIVKFKKGGGHAGHNGLRDIVMHLGTKDFCRLRVGIGRPCGKMAVADYVLSAPSSDENEKINTALLSACVNLELLIRGEFDRFMMKMHSI